MACICIKCLQGVIYIEFYFIEAGCMKAFRLWIVHCNLPCKAELYIQCIWTVWEIITLQGESLPVMVVTSHPASKSMTCSRSFHYGIFPKLSYVSFMNKQELHSAYWLCLEFVGPHSMLLLWKPFKAISVITFITHKTVPGSYIMWRVVNSCKGAWRAIQSWFWGWMWIQSISCRMIHMLKMVLLAMPQMLMLLWILTVMSSV